MDLRRGLLLLAITLLVVAGVSSLVRPAPESNDAPAPAPAAPDDSSESADEPTRIKFTATAGSPLDRPRPKTVKAGARVIITVTASEPGLVELDGLGRVAPAQSGTPAVFDVLVDRPGRFDVVFKPTDGIDRRAGMLVVEGSATG